MSRGNKRKKRDEKRKRKAEKKAFKKWRKENKAKIKAREFLKSEYVNELGFKQDSLIANMGIEDRFSAMNDSLDSYVDKNNIVHSSVCLCRKCKQNNPPKSSKKNKHARKKSDTGYFRPIGYKKKTKKVKQIEITDSKVLAFIEIKREFDKASGLDKDKFLEAVKTNDVIQSIMRGKKEFKAKEKEYGDTYRMIKDDSSKTPMLNQCFKPIITKSAMNRTPIISNSYLDRKKSKTLRDYKKSNIDELNSSFVSRFVNRFKRSRSIY